MGKKPQAINSVSLFLTVAVCLFAAGCSTNVSRFQMPGTDLSDVQMLYIVAPDDDRQAEQLRSRIESNLERRGYQFASEGDSVVYADGEYLFDYATDWHWDITWYLLELRVAIYDPADNTLIAQAQSQQTSLVRKSVEDVVDRAMASLFDDLVTPNGDN